MSDTQGDRPVSVWARVIGGTAVIAVLAAAGTGWGIAQHNAQVQADAAHAMTVAAPAYEGTSTFDGNLVALNTQSVQAKQAFDVEQARLAAEKAAQEAAAAAAQAAAAASAQAAADQAAQEQAQQQQTVSSQSDTTSPGSDSGPILCPAGTTPNAVDAAGNESNCQADGPGGEQCTAYDANNNCTNWYKP